MKTRSLRRVVLCSALAFLTALATAHAQAPVATAEAAAMKLATLSSEDLDALEEATGYRLGVQVVDVQAGSAAAAAGVKTGDVIFAVGKTGVASAEQAVGALRTATGEVLLTALSQAAGDWQAVQYKLNLAAQEAPAPSAGPGEAGDPIAAYFDMLDFTRTAAWGRKCTTPAEERQRVGQLVLANWEQLGAQGQATIKQIPQVWESVRQEWAAADEGKKRNLVKTWGQNLLAPNMLYPPPAAVQSYRSPGGEMSLEYPADWSGAQQEIGGTPMLALVPPGVETTWEKVLDPPNSPPGALMGLVQKDQQMAALPSFTAGVRLLGQLLFKDGLSAFKEISVLDLGTQGAVIAYLGKFPGQQEEKFYWVGAVPFGSAAIVVVRLGGPVSQAEQLVPALHHILDTVKLTPPQAAGGGGVSGAWEAAWSRVDVAITKNIWAPSGD